MNKFRRVTVRYLGEQELWVFVSVFNLDISKKETTDYLWADDKSKPIKYSIVKDDIAKKSFNMVSMSYLDRVLNFFKLHTLKVY